MSKTLTIHGVQGNGVIPIVMIGGLIYLAAGTTVPTDATGGFGIGCIFIHTDGGVGTTLYANEGSTTSCDFDAISVA